MQKKDVNEPKQTLCFGSYPQSLVTDEEIIRRLEQKMGKLPTRGPNRRWNSYPFYRDGDGSLAFSWYIDLDDPSGKYRGVYFTAQRPAMTEVGEDAGEDASASLQKANGFTPKRVYWFRYEPIEWRILGKADECALLLSEKVLFSSQFFSQEHLGYFESRVFRKNAEINDYKESDLRKTIDDLLKTAFGDKEKEMLFEIELDNGERTTFPNDKTQWGTASGKNDYACASFKTQLFALSVQEVTDDHLGFDPDPNAADPARRKAPTDYARALGVGVSTEEGVGNGCSPWWLRSPSESDRVEACCVVPDGSTDRQTCILSTYVGLAPALWYVFKE